MKSRLEKYRRPKFGVLTKQYNTKLPDDLAEEMEELCVELDMTPSEFIRYLIYEEIQELKRTKIPVSTPSFTEVPKETIRKPVTYIPPVRKKSSGGRRGSIQQWVVKGEAPCPICGTWSTTSNFKRDHADKHGYDSSYDLITSHIEKVEQMFKERTTRS